MVNVINLLSSVFSSVFAFMRSWEILPGISLLTFNITVLLLSILFKLLFTVVKPSDSKSNKDTSNKGD